MKEATSFYCNCEYILVPISIIELRKVLKQGLSCECYSKPTLMDGDTLLPQKHDGVYGITVFRQWKSFDLAKVNLMGLGTHDQVLLRLDKSVLLYVPFHFNKVENYGHKHPNNTLVSTNATTDSDCPSVWSYDVVRNSNDLCLNEIVFHKDIVADFIKEIWYFTEHVPYALYNFHCKKKLVCNPDHKFL